MTLAPVEPAQQAPDYLAGSVLRSLGRPVGWDAAWGLAKTLLLSVVTLGLLPLLTWPRKTRSLMHTEREQFRHVVEWLRLYRGPASIGRLTLAADRVRPNFFLTRLPAFVAALTAIGVAIRVDDLNFPPLRFLLASTVGFGKGHPSWQPWAEDVFAVWTFGLLVGYVLHWAQLAAYTARVRTFVRAFNDFVSAEGLPTAPEPRGVGFRPAWVGCGVLMIPLASALWAVPMMLAGAMQWRYAAVTVPAVRSYLAARVQDLLAIQRPGMRLPKQIMRTRRCPNDKCRAGLEAVANFCTRCGTHVGPEVNALA